MSAGARTNRDLRRRRLGQNFLSPQAAERFVDAANLRAGELVVEVGAGRGAITLALAARNVDVIAVELDPEWAKHVRARTREFANVKVVQADFLRYQLPDKPFRVVGSIPFSRTTEILKRLLDEPASKLMRVDLVVQWEVAQKRSKMPPTTLLSTIWAPWWEVRLGRRIRSSQFRPRPKTDGGVLTIVRRNPPILPISLAQAYATFIRENWPL